MKCAIIWIAVHLICALYIAILAKSAPESDEPDRIPKDQLNQ